jgi:hypothetical protein
MMAETQSVSHDLRSRARELGIPEHHSGFYWIAEQSLEAVPLGKPLAAEGLADGWVFVAEANEYFNPSIQKRQQQHPALDYYKQLYDILGKESAELSQHPESSPQEATAKLASFTLGPQHPDLLGALDTLQKCLASVTAILVVS